jgi:hypothetical protein
MTERSEENPITLNEFIIANASGGGDESFLRNFRDAEVYFPVDPSLVPKVNEPTKLPPGVKITVPVAESDIGRMVVYYASRKDRRLTGPVIGTPLIRAAEKVFNTPELDGMIIHSDSNVFFVAKKPVLEAAKEIAKNRGVRPR